jgi:hypothetical protein
MTVEPQQPSSDYSPKPLKLNLKINSSGLFSKQIPSKSSQKGMMGIIGGSKKKANCNDTTYLLGSHMCNNFFQNESINLSNLNLTNEYSSLSPTHNNNQSNLNNSSLILKNNGLQKRIFRMNNVLASPSAKVDSIVNAIGCQTVKSSGIGNKSFNLKIKLKNESSLKKLKLST